MLNLSNQEYLFNNLFIQARQAVLGLRLGKHETIEIGPHHILCLRFETSSYYNPRVGTPQVTISAYHTGAGWKQLFCETHFVNLSKERATAPEADMEVIRGYIRAAIAALKADGAPIIG